MNVCVVLERRGNKNEYKKTHTHIDNRSPYESLSRHSHARHISMSKLQCTFGQISSRRIKVI